MRLRQYTIPPPDKETPLNSNKRDPVDTFFIPDLCRVRAVFLLVITSELLVLVLASALTWWLLNKTLMGRAVYAVGGSLAIAERLGYKLRSVHLFVFGYAGFLSGLAGIVHVSSTRLANPFDLVGSELDVIAAVVLGGARITGGHGSVVGTLLGVLLVTLINNVLILAGVPSTWQKAIIGGFIVLAGAVFALRREK